MVVMLALFIMASGYAIYQKRLDIGGIANIDYKDWNIRILSIDTVDSSNGVDVVKPSHTNTTAKFNSKITKVGGFIKYKIVVKNSGTIDGVLGAINIEETEDSVITYTIEGAEISDELLAGEEATIYVTATYDSSKVDTATSNKSNVSINLNYVQLEGYVPPTPPVSTVYLREGEYNYQETDKWLSGDLANNQIEAISFSDSSDVPSDALGSYSLAEDDSDEIMAWYYDADDNGLYEVVVGENGGVRANPLSSNLFSFLTELKTINFDNFITTYVNSFYGMFESASALEEIDISGFDFSSATNISAMFREMTSLETIIGIETLDVSKYDSLYAMFSGCASLETLNLSQWNVSNIEDFSYMFSDTINLASVNLNNWKTSSATNMGSLFNSSGIESLDLSHFDVDQVTSFGWMFYNTPYLTTINLSNWKTSSLEEMDYMFSNSGVKSLDLTHFNTSNVTTMESLFSSADSLTNLNISGWNTSNVETMAGMFYSGVAADLDLSSFDTSKVTDMSEMFEFNDAVVTLDLSSFNTSSLTKTMWMFAGASNLTTIYVSDLWTNDLITKSNYMFDDLNKIVGGSGTTFDSSKIDVSMANYNTGYFTYKKYVGPTAESCFTFNSSTKKITGYDIDTCGADVIIPSTIGGVEVKTIGYGAFSLLGVNSAVIPDTVETIEGYSFDYTGLTSITFGKNVKTIGDGAFEDNDLSEVVLPNSVESIGMFAFNRNMISNINFPSSITYIGNGAFNVNQIPESQAIIYKRNSDGSIDTTTIMSYGNKNVTTLTIPEGVTTIAEYAFWMDGLQSLTLPNSLTTIEDMGFCSNNIRSIVIPDSVTTIGEDAFSHNYLSTVTIGSGVTSIGRKAFYVNNNNGSNRILSSIINKTGRAFDWGLIINDSTADSFITGTIESNYGTVNITSN